MPSWGQSWGRLLRLSLAPTAAADVAAGIVLGAASWPAGSAPFALVSSSLCVYHGALALNDWADRERDRIHRPERPIPAGAIPPALALGAGLALLAGGPALALVASTRSGVLLLAVGLLALAYDLGPRGPWLGPTLLALCRAGNLASGILLGLDRIDVRLLLPLFYGTYVFLVSRLGRLEDEQDRVEERALHPRWLAAGAALLLLSPAGLFGIARDMDRSILVSLAIGAAGAAGLLARALGGTSRGTNGGTNWSARAIQRLMGMALRRLLLFTAAVAVLPGTRDAWIVAALILCGYPLSFLLRRAFPPS